MSVAAAEADRAEVLALAEAVADRDGAPPLSDRALLRIGRPGLTETVVRDGAALRGYAQLDEDGAAEIAGDASAVEELVAALPADRTVRLWAHGRRSVVHQAAARHGFARMRELWQLHRPLTDLPEPRAAAGVLIRPFEVGRDEDAWLAVNAAAFAAHAEQGRWTRADLEAREAEPWFDPAGFLLAERDASLLGYHWTKVHRRERLGEVYVLGVAPAAQGLALGTTLLVAGLWYLAEQDLPAAMLYVDGDNPGAMALYMKYGFTQANLDVQYRRDAAHG